MSPPTGSDRLQAAGNWDTRLVELEARVAALEADTWSHSPSGVRAARAFQAQAGAATQTTFSVSGDPPSHPKVESAAEDSQNKERVVLITNLEGSRKGTAGRYESTHLVVPTSLRPPGSSPRTFCGWPFADGRVAVSYRADLGAGEVCEKCLPGLSRRVAARRLALAKSAAGQVIDPDAYGAEGTH